MLDITCPVGHKFSGGVIPSPHLLVLISEAEMDSLTNEILDAAKGDDPAKDVWTKLWLAGQDVYICPTCERLVIYRGDVNDISASYVKEPLQKE